MSFLPGMFPAGAFTGNRGPRLRYVGNYNAFFSAGTTSNTITVPALDLQYSGANRQIVVIASAATVEINAATINGVAANRSGLAANGFIEIFSAFYAGAGPFNVVLTAASSNSDDFSVSVYEVLDAAPIYKGAVNGNALASVTTVNMPIRVPNKGLLVGGASFATDTQTATWTGLIEDVDIDAGNDRNSAASLTTNAAGGTDIAASVVASGSGTQAGVVQAIIPDSDALSVVFDSHQAFTMPPTNLTLTNYSFANRGDFRLVCIANCEFNQSVIGMTFNGNAMTLLGSTINTSASPDLRQYAFYIDVTSAAAVGNFVVQLSANASGATIDFAFYRIYNFGSFGSVISDSGNGTGNALAVTVAEGGTILAAHMRGTDTQAVTWSGAFALRELDFGSHRGSHAFYPYAAAETNRIVQATAASGEWASLAFAINP